jgi:hypothetical protein
MMVGQKSLRQRHGVDVFQTGFFLCLAVIAVAAFDSLTIAGENAAMAGEMGVEDPLLLVGVEITEEEENFEGAVEGKPACVRK